MAFDTGLAKPQRTLIRAALATALAPLLKANGKYVRSIGALPKPLRSRDEEELGLLAHAIRGQTPALLIALGDRSVEGASTDALEVDSSIEIVIYAASSNARSYVDGRLESDVVSAADPTADPGIEVMLEDVMQQLLGQELDIPTTREVRMSLESELYTFEEYTVWAQTYAIRANTTINPDRTITQVVTEVQVTTTFPAGDPAGVEVTTLTELEAP